MAFSIGRAGKTLVLNDPSMWAEQNGQATVTITTQVSPATDALRLRDQLLGYVDNWDEPIVPVICDTEPRRTGYYRVTGVQIDTDPVAVSLGIFTAYVSLEPVMGFTQPMIESILSGALLTNAVGAVIGDSWDWIVIPSSSADYRPISAAFSGSATRSSADGNLFMSSTVGSFPSGSATFSLSPANFYTGAATIEQGATLQPIVGRTLTQADPTNWRLSNGLVRVTPNGGKLDIAHWKGASWAAAKTYKLQTVGPVLFAAPSAVTVLRNSVEECIIRLNTVTSTLGPPITVDLSLRRGDRLVRIYLTSGATTLPTFAVFRDTIEAATAITYGAVTLGGIRATANDADGNQYVIFSYQRAAPVNDLVNGGITQGAAGSADYAIGSIVPGGASSPDGPTHLASQYLAAVSESQRIVAR